MSKAVLLDAGSFHPDDLDWDELPALFTQCDIHDFTAAEDTATRIKGCEVVFTNKCRLNAEHFAGNPDLKLVVVLATGTNNIDHDAARAANVAVCNIRDYATTELVEHSLMLILALMRKLIPYRDAVQRGDWSRSKQFCLLDPPIQRLRGKTLGIIGMGASGRGLADACSALGMEIIALHSTRSNDGPYPRTDLENLLKTADVVSLHCPLTDDNAELINKNTLALMKPTAILINTARGGLINDKDLVAALGSAAIGGAGIDVVQPEPPQADHPLLVYTHPNLIVTPHNAWGSREARQALIEQAADIVRDYQRTNHAR